MTDEARDKACVDFLALNTPENYLGGSRSHLLHHHFQTGVNTAWDHLWPKWRKSEADADRLARRFAFLSGVVMSAISELKRGTGPSFVVDALQEALKETNG